MTEQATLRSLARRRFLLGADRPACRPDRPDAEPSGRGRDSRAIGPAAPSPYRRNAPLGVLSPTAATSAVPSMRRRITCATGATTHNCQSIRSSSTCSGRCARALDTSEPDPGVLRLPLARDQRHAAPYPPWRRPPQPAHAGDGDRPAGGGPPAAQCPSCRRGAQKRRRGLLSALRLRPRRHGRHPLLVSRQGRACHSGHGRLRHHRSVARPG